MLVFVYGTLKNNCSNHEVLRKILKTNGYISVKTIEKYPLYKLSDPFPYLENKPGVGKRIKGQIFDIKEKNEKILDNFEGVPDLYKKGTIDVLDSMGNIYKNVNVYFRAKPLYSFENIELIDDWMEWFLS